MKRKIFLAITLYVIGITSHSQASLIPNIGQFEVGAEWLYWQDFQDNLEYAAEVSAFEGTINSRPLIQIVAIVFLPPICRQDHPGQSEDNLPIGIPKRLWRLS